MNANLRSVEGAVIVVLLLISSIQFIRCSIVIVSPTDTDTITISPAPHVVFGPVPFDITGELVVAEPFDGCAPITNNVTNKIVVFKYDTCLTDVLMRRSIEAGALGVIINGGVWKPFITYYLTDAISVGEIIDIGTVCIDDSQWMQLEEIINGTSDPIIVRITSGDFNVYTETTRTPAFWILHILLAALATLICIYGVHKLALYIKFYGPEFSIAQVSLTLLSISAAVSTLANVIVICHFFYNPIPDATYMAIYVSGPMFVIIATILVGLYWSGLIFHKKQKKFWNKYLFGAVITLLGLLFLLDVFASIFIREATDILLVILIVIALLIGLYFIIIGSILIARIVKNSRKINIISTKKRYPERLVKMLVVSGVSLILFVIMSMLTQSELYSVTDWQFFILGMIQFFSMMTVAAEITLFKTIKRDPKSYSGSNPKSSVHSTSISSGTTEGASNINNGSTSTR